MTVPPEALPRARGPGRWPPPAPLAARGSAGLCGPSSAGPSRCGPLANLAPAPIKDIKIAAFNTKTFGSKKIKNEKVFDYFVRLIKRYDVIFLQEIRNKNLSAVHKLYAALNERSKEYDYRITRPLGRNSYKEQYAYFYKKRVFEELMIIPPDIGEYFYISEVQRIINAMPEVVRTPPRDGVKVKNLSSGKYSSYSYDIEGNRHPNDSYIYIPKNSIWEIKYLDDITGTIGTA